MKIAKLCETAGMIVRSAIGRALIIALRLVLATLLIFSISGCSSQPPEEARTALKIILGEYPIVYARKVEVRGFAEFWCVIVGGPKTYTLASAQILESFDGGWNASTYLDRSKWEEDCGAVPDEYTHGIDED